MGSLLKWRSILIRLGWLYLVGCFLLVLNGKVRAEQQAGPIVEKAVMSSNIYLVQADQKDSNDDSTIETQDEPVKKKEWEPSAPTPRPEKFDWIQIKSGEWLKGTLKGLYDKKLEFDSKEFDLQEFDFEDVRQIRGHSIFSVRFEGPMTVYGYLEVTQTKVYVTLGEDKQEFDRNKLISIASGAEKEIDNWSAKLDIGVNYTRGNTDQMQYNAMLKVMRRTTASRLNFDYLGNFTRTEGIETINNHRLSGFYDLFKTRKYFFRPVFGEYFRDPIQNIGRRVTLGTGIGYHFIDTPKTKWDATAGPAYQTSEFISVEPGEDLKQSTPSFTFSTAFKTDITKRVELKTNYNFQIVNEASGSFLHHFITTLETKIWKWLDFDISFVWDRTKDPIPRADSTVPEQNDFQLIFSIGVDL